MPAEPAAVKAERSAEQRWIDALPTDGTAVPADVARAASGLSANAWSIIEWQMVASGIAQRIIPGKLRSLLPGSQSSVM